VTVPLARAGFQVTAVDVSGEMLAALATRLEGEAGDVRRRVEMEEQDLRRLHLDRLFRFICMPFNSFLLFSLPQERQQVLDGVRELLAPSGAFGFEAFTPDPARMVPSHEWETDLEHEIDDPGGGGRVRVVRQIKRDIDLGRQVLRSRFRHRIHRADGGAELAAWEDELELAFMFPRELDLLLERQGFRVHSRHGGPNQEPYQPTSKDVQPQYLVARVAP
jgi:hypothetical protein